MKPIIYKSTDTGAPQLTVTAGAMNAVIKACLVAGYGSKAAAGWDVVYEDLVTKKLAIRSTNPKSIKSVLLLDDTATKKAEVAAYTEWNNTTNTGVNGFGTGAFFKNMTGSGSTAKWVVVATDNFFYLWTQNDFGYPSLGVVSAFGDAKSFVNTADYSVLMALATTATDTSSSTTHTSVRISSGGVATFATPPFKQEYVGLGDRQPTATASPTSPTIFSEYVLYITTSGKISSELSLRGLLMPYLEVVTPPVIDGLPTLVDQVPFINPVIGLRQPYSGHIWLHTDDWG